MLAIGNCSADSCSWVINDKLVLNNDKTEFLVIGTSKQLSKVYVSSTRDSDVDVISTLGKKSGFLVRLAHGHGNA